MATRFEQCQGLVVVTDQPVGCGTLRRCFGAPGILKDVQGQAHACGA